MLHSKYKTYFFSFQIFNLVFGWSSSSVEQRNFSPTSRSIMERNDIDGGSTVNMNTYQTQTENTRSIITLNHRSENPNRNSEEQIRQLIASLGKDVNRISEEIEKKREELLLENTKKQIRHNIAPLARDLNKVGKKLTKHLNEISCKQLSLEEQVKLLHDGQKNIIAHLNFLKFLWITSFSCLAVFVIFKFCKRSKIPHSYYHSTHFKAPLILPPYSFYRQKIQLN